MTPVTTKRRAPHRVDARRHQGTGRSAAQLPTLFDTASPAAPVVLNDGPGRVAVQVDAGHRVADPSITADNGETLDRLVVSSWERLVNHAEASCLLCGGTMEPRYGSRAASIGGRCRDCGTTLG
jgi:hypothetical protein